MRRGFFLFLLILSQLIVHAQGRVQLISSESLTGYGSGGLQHVIRPIFNHEGSTLSSDSANYNPTLNTFDAFGHVVITQSDGTTIYSDLLNYNGNNNVALLTNNVRMVDKDATLTTNYLTYNTATKIGTYTGGGKIVNAQNVVTSKNGYYFASTRDAYFRYNAVVTSPDAVIKSDTLRYNTGSKIAFFYGPTNIYGKDDTLYTENGNYNTLSDQARFGKKNLYKQGSKSLKGDSLFYDRNAGFGRAIKNVTFVDTEQKIILKGDLGIYRKLDESILVTQGAYVVMSSEADSGKVDSIWMTADTLFSKVVLKKTIKLIPKAVIVKDTDIKEDPIDKENEVLPQEFPGAAEFEAESSESKSSKDSSDVKVSNEIKLKELPKPSKIESPPKGKNTQTDSLISKKPAKQTKDITLLLPDSLANNLRDSVKNVKAVTSTDTIFKKKIALTGNLSKSDVDTASADTSRVRIILAFHHAKVFKSDLQAKADSMFFSYADSTLRCYYDPIIWAQGSQLSADTVYMQLKNNKMDNILLRHAGFIVNTEGDSSRFNQIKGKTLTGFFKNSKLNQMFVDGNAESIYYAKEDSTYSGMNKSVSSRMKVLFDDNKLQDVIFIRKPEMNYYPIDKLPQDTVLKGFIWKPKERPKSKEEIIASLKPAKISKPAAPVKKKASPTPIKAIKKED